MPRKNALPEVEWTKLRFAVMERDGWECRWCGKRRDLTVHHIDARGAGGGDVEENLITLCARCHEWIQRRWRRFVEYLKGEAARLILRRDARGGG